MAIVEYQPVFSQLPVNKTPNGMHAFNTVRKGRVVVTNFGHLSCTGYCRKPFVEACRDVLAQKLNYSSAMN